MLQQHLQLSPGFRDQTVRRRRHAVSGLYQREAVEQYRHLDELVGRPDWGRGTGPRLEQPEVRKFSLLAGCFATSCDQLRPRPPLWSWQEIRRQPKWNRR